MPAAARKRHAVVVPDERAHRASRHTATGRPLRNPRPRGQAAAPAYDWEFPIAPAPRPLDERDAPSYESSLEFSAKARLARRRARRRHRPFHLTWKATVACCILMLQLVALLWMQGVALSARNRSYKLDKDIADKYSAVTRTQKEIAGLDSAARIAAWAQERGWQVASQDRLDSVTNLTPVADEETAPAVVTPAVKIVTSKHQTQRHHKAAPAKVEIKAMDDNTVDDAAMDNNTDNSVGSAAAAPIHNDEPAPNDNSASSAQAGDD